MQKQLFIVDIKLKSWNEIACKHWRVYKAAADEAKQATWVALNNYGIKPCTGPVELHVHAKWRGNRRRDIDAVYAKGIVDQMVTDKILPDDNLNIVTSVLYTGETGANKNEVIVTLAET